MFGMKALGVKGRSSWGRMLVSNAFSMVLMATAVSTLKQSTLRMRPDGSKRNSFPSGHTANAFMGATILHKEYGATVSPWISVGAYTIATATAIGRQLNNHHWLSDVMVGAGIGILSAEIGYILGDLIFKDKGLLKEKLIDDPLSLEMHPSFLGYYLGTSHIGRFISESESIQIKIQTGVTAGVEGAYFFSPYIGFGGKFNASNATINLQGFPIGTLEQTGTVGLIESINQVEAINKIGTAYPTVGTTNNSTVTKATQSTATTVSTATSAMAIETTKMATTIYSVAIPNVITTVYSAPIDIISLAAGVYASYPISKCLHIGSKALLGYTSASRVSLTESLRIKPFQTFYLEIGCSFFIFLSKRFAIRPFYDLSLLPKVMDVMIENNKLSKRLNGKSMLCNSTFAISANIVF